MHKALDLSKVINDARQTEIEARIHFIQNLKDINDLVYSSFVIRTFVDPITNKEQVISYLSNQPAIEMELKLEEDIDEIEKIKILINLIAYYKDYSKTRTDFLEKYYYFKFIFALRKNADKSFGISPLAFICNAIGAYISIGLKYKTFIDYFEVSVAYLEKLLVYKPPKESDWITE